MVLPDAPAFHLFLCIQNRARDRTLSPTTLRVTPMAIFAPVFRPLELGLGDEVDDTVCAVVVGDVSVLEEPIVEDGAKLYPLTWTAYTLAPSAEIVAVVVCGLGLKLM